MVHVRAERLGKIIFLHAWLGLSVKKGTQLRAGGRWQIKAASFLTDLPCVRPGRARGGKEQWESPPEKPTPSTCTQWGKNKKSDGCTWKGFPEPRGRWVWSGCDGCGHRQALRAGAVWDPCSHQDSSGGCQSSLKKPNAVDGLKKPNPSPSSARDLLQLSPSASRNRSRLGRGA